MDSTHGDRGASSLTRRSLLQDAATLAAAAAVPAGHAMTASAERGMKTDIGFVDIGSGMKLRRLRVSNPKPKGTVGTVLFLHGFPETLYVWKDIAVALAGDYQVHAFDWPGYGLSSRPPADEFAYAPMDYARVLKAYIEKARIRKSGLCIYATDIGALPALLLALQEPGIARSLIVGDFAPFDRPAYMHENLQGLKSQPSADAIHAAMNKNRDDILQNAYRRGFSKDEQFDISPEIAEDMSRGWSQGGLTSADAFFHYYAHFTRDQDYFEANLAKLRTPAKVIWGERDFYIKKEMGIEFAEKAHLKISVLPALGHYPHLQSPRHVIDEVRGSLGGR